MKLAISVFTEKKFNLKTNELILHLYDNPFKLLVNVLKYTKFRLKDKIFISFKTLSLQFILVYRIKIRN